MCVCVGAHVYDIATRVQQNSLFVLDSYSRSFLSQIHTFSYGEYPFVVLLRHLVLYISNSHRLGQGKVDK